MALISLIHPSRGRAEKSRETAKKWTDNSGLEVGQIELIVSLDDSDPELNNYYKVYSDVLNLTVTNNNKSVVDATNHACKFAKGDILIYLSDDFDCPSNWGPLVLKEFEEEERPLLLKVHDNLQDFNARVLTIPIMNRLLYEKLKYFWHPGYKSMWVDCDLFETVSRIGALKNVRHLVFPHEHHSIGKAENDETYKRSEANWDQGLKLFNERKRLNFPL